MNDLELLSVLAVFPSSFSYAYVKKVLSCKGKDGNMNPRELLIKLEKHSLIQDDSRADETNQDECSEEQHYMIHSFFCRYIRDQYWNDSREHYYRASYFKLYINELFALGRSTLEKDNFKNCWEKFEMEQQNFLSVMSHIGEIYDEEVCPSHIMDVISELSTRETPDIIAMYIFCSDLTNPSLLLKFLEVCHRVADDDKKKKSIWCCCFDLNMKYFEIEIDDPCKELEPDEYGKSLLHKCRIARKLNTFFERERIGNL